MSGDDSLVERQVDLEQAQRALSALDDVALVEHWPPDERAALADERDAVADEVDEVAVSFDGRAERRDEDAVSRQVATSSRQRRDVGNQSGSDDAVYGRYMAARDQDGTASDRADAAADRSRSATSREVAADARRRSAADRDESARLISDLDESDGLESSDLSGTS